MSCCPAEPCAEQHIHQQRLITGDCLAVLATLPPDSVDVVVTSPPYNLALGYNTYRDQRGESDYLAWMVAVCTALRAATTLPLWIKPNAGLPRMVDGKAVYDIATREFADEAAKLVQEGATFIGGCCGTSPDFIRVLKETLG